MINPDTTFTAFCVRRAAPALRLLTLSVLSAALIAMAGCGMGKIGKKNDEFFTSGSREADQRASQRMAKAEQLAGSGEGAGERGVKKAKLANPGADGALPGDPNKPALVEGKLALFDRLGGEAGLSNIVADFLPRALQDPRVNWQRKKDTNSGFFHRNPSVVWNPTKENIAVLQRHLVQFLALATGGPAQYGGKEMQSTHAGMRISNPEFDAVIGDLKASLDKLKTPNKEQKELLAIIESTRPQIVTLR